MKKSISLLLTLLYLIHFTCYYAFAGTKIDNNYKDAQGDFNTIVDNIAPNVGFSLSKKKLADMVVLTDYTGSNVTNLTTELNSLKSNLSSVNVDMQYSIIDGNNKAHIGDIVTSDAPMAIGYCPSLSGDTYIGVASDSSVVNSNRSFTVDLSNIKAVRTCTGGYYIHNKYIDFPGTSFFAITDSGELYGWGYSTYAITLFPVDYNEKVVYTPRLFTDISNVKDYQPNGWYGVALKNDGTVWYNGNLVFSRLDFQAPISGSVYYSFHQLTEYSNIKQIVNTGNFILALKEDGTVWGQGDNICYGLGDVPCSGTRDSEGYYRWLTNGMVRVAGLTNVVKIFGYDHCAFAVKSDGSVWAWGANYYSKVLGVESDGLSRLYYVNYDTYRYKGQCVYSPKQIPGLDGNSIAQITGVYTYDKVPLYTLILKTDGTVWKLDENGLTQVQYAHSNIPLNNVIYIDSKPRRTAYLKKDGTVLLEITNEDYVSIVTFNNTGINPSRSVYGVDISKVYEKTLRKGSDRYFICISNSSGNNYSAGFGSYYSFGGLNTALVEYLGKNDFAIYAAVPTSAFDYISDTGRQEISIRNLVNSSVEEGGLYDITQKSSIWSYIYNKYLDADPDNKITQYVVIDEDKIEYSTYYDDGSNDPIYSGQWKYTHDPTVFDNNSGAASFSGQWRSTPLLSFSHVGKYDVIYRGTDNPKNNANFASFRKSGDTSAMTIYAHRRPIAQASVNFSGIDGNGMYITSTVSTSYDLDHTSRVDKGIVQEEWAWKEVSDTSWTTGKLPGLLPPNKTYIVRLRVMDLESAWSDPFVLTVKTQPSNQPPNVDAIPINRDWGNTNVTCTITASDINGDYSYTNYMWSNSPVKPASGWAKNTAGSFAVTLATEGSWYLHMEAFDAAGNSFYRMRGPYNIDKTAPSGEFNPNTHSWTNKDVSVIFAPSDAGGSGVKQWRYRISADNGSTYGSWSGYITDDTNGTITLSTTGRNKIQAEVQDNAGNIGYATSGTYYIDKVAPTVNATPGTLTGNEPIKVTVTASDESGSGLKQTNYKWTTSTTKPAGGWTTVTTSSFATTLSDDSNVFYLHVEAFDNAGNSTYMLYGPYKYDAVKITNVKITGYWNHWRGQIDLLGNRMTSEPHRFLSLEKVRIEVVTAGNPDRVEIRFSPELESMFYEDPNGNVYDYGQMIGYYISFPYRLDVNNNTAVWEYILPLAPSTKDWDNNILRSPYWMEVTAFKGTSSDTYVVADINITGNVYDLIYIQPAD